MLDLRPNPLNISLNPIGTRVAQAGAVPAAPRAPVATAAVVAVHIAPVAGTAVAAAPVGTLTLPPVSTQTTTLPRRRLARVGAPVLPSRALRREPGQAADALRARRVLVERPRRGRSVVFRPPPVPRAHAGLWRSGCAAATAGRASRASRMARMRGMVSRETPQRSAL